MHRRFYSFGTIILYAIFLIIHENFVFVKSKTCIFFVVWINRQKKHFDIYLNCIIFTKS